MSQGNPPSVFAQAQNSLATHQTEPSLQLPTREYLEKNFNKPDLQKRCRELGLTKVWVTKDELITMILRQLIPQATDNPDVQLLPSGEQRPGPSPPCEQLRALLPPDKQQEQQLAAPPPDEQLRAPPSSDEQPLGPLPSDDPQPDLPCSDGIETASTSPDVQRPASPGHQVTETTDITPPISTQPATSPSDDHQRPSTPSSSLSTVSICTPRLYISGHHTDCLHTIRCPAHRFFKSRLHERNQ